MDKDFITLEETKDQLIGEVGTQKRDDYEEENAEDPKNCYVEFASEDIGDIRDILTIVGKHVYNKDNGEYVDLIIE